MAPRLKVFVTSDGLTDYVVAASSKPKALAAWGSHQDLFKTGLAHETDDPELVTAATAQPGEVLRRPADARAALARLTPAKKTTGAAKPAPAKLELVKPKPSPAALKKVADLEKRLADLDAEHAAAKADLERRRAELDRQAEALDAEHAAKRAKFETALSAARRALG